MVCTHQNYEPVELVLTGEVVAQVCVDCLVALPADYDGTVQCLWVWGRNEPVRVIVTPPDEDWPHEWPY